MKSDAMTGIV